MRKFNIGLLKNSVELKPKLISVLTRADNDFFPPLSSRLDFDKYADKILSSAFLIGASDSSAETETTPLIPNFLHALYIGYADVANYEYAFSSFMWVDPEYRTFFLGYRMHDCAKRYVRSLNMKGIRAKTWREGNEKTLLFWKNLGYKCSEPVYNPTLKRHEVNIELTF